MIDRSVRLKPKSCHDEKNQLVSDAVYPTIGISWMHPSQIVFLRCTHIEMQHFMERTCLSDTKTPQKRGQTKPITNISFLKYHLRWIWNVDCISQKFPKTRLVLVIFLRESKTHHLVFFCDNPVVSRLPTEFGLIPIC